MPVGKWLAQFLRGWMAYDAVAGAIGAVAVAAAYGYVAARQRLGQQNDVRLDVPMFNGGDRAGNAADPVPSCGPTAIGRRRSEFRKKRNRRWRRVIERGARRPAKG